ncbi:MAG: DUF4357 domain-containing protein [Bryobacteraceae bacterium]|nr:DUF4357 domain-containing protein [Bryobacteraceae bacterium]
MTIDISFEVFKALTALRENESVTYDHVLRKLLRLERASEKPAIEQSSPNGAWIAKGVVFPGGTLFRATHKGKTYTGTVEDGALRVDGRSYSSPSQAAVAITGNSVNGWIFWECKLPGQSGWQMLKTLRKKV